jgi:hypothetical protein
MSDMVVALLCRKSWLMIYYYTPMLNLRRKHELKREYHRKSCFCRKKNRQSYRENKSRPPHIMYMTNGREEISDLAGFNFNKQLKSNAFR